ncbi:hypothetical protein LTR70_004645 [Exophiala xenobiotica]|uniref:Uncharacterized protein n=1 Tax=Lithohypha guttulata TaxID=1690604 RepID=A0ABR0KD29_9EURO|nr:hypothetical protein LTR24_004235 [Lithohypha guttulata]KAK5320282.1 hypothetical protein LTR70_004645 [Exophiala xenobiotica]
MKGLGDILRLTGNKRTRKEDKRLLRSYEARGSDGTHYLVYVYADGHKVRRRLGAIPEDECPEEDEVRLRDDRGKERARDETAANGQFSDDYPVPVQDGQVDDEITYMNDTGYGGFDSYEDDEAVEGTHEVPPGHFSRSDGQPLREPTPSVRSNPPAFHEYFVASPTSASQPIAQMTHHEGDPQYYISQHDGFSRGQPVVERDMPESKSQYDNVSRVQAMQQRGFSITNSQHDYASRVSGKAPSGTGSKYSETSKSREPDLRKHTLEQQANCSAWEAEVASYKFGPNWNFVESHGDEVQPHEVLPDDSASSVGTRDSHRHRRPKDGSVARHSDTRSVGTKASAHPDLTDQTLSREMANEGVARTPAGSEGGRTASESRSSLGKSRAESVFSDRSGGVGSEGGRTPSESRSNLGKSRAESVFSNRSGGSGSSQSSFAGSAPSQAPSVLSGHTASVNSNAPSRLSGYAASASSYASSASGASSSSKAKDKAASVITPQAPKTTNVSSKLSQVSTSSRAPSVASSWATTASGISSRSSQHASPPRSSTAMSSTTKPKAAVNPVEAKKPKVKTMKVGSTKAKNGRSVR